MLSGGGDRRRHVLVRRQRATANRRRHPHRGSGWGFATGILLNLHDDPRHQRIRPLMGVPRRVAEASRGDPALDLVEDLQPRTATRPVQLGGQAIAVGEKVTLWCFAAIEATGSCEFTRSDKHSGVRHLPVRFVAC